MNRTLVLAAIGGVSALVIGGVAYAANKTEEPKPAPVGGQTNLNVVQTGTNTPVETAASFYAVPAYVQEVIPVPPPRAPAPPAPAPAPPAPRQIVTPPGLLQFPLPPLTPPRRQIVTPPGLLQTPLPSLPSGRRIITPPGLLQFPLPPLR